MCKKREERILRSKYSKLKYRHKETLGKDVEKIISFEKFVYISKQDCFYCKDSGSIELNDYFDGKLFSDTVVKINGIDRIKNDKGYEAGNIIPCCTTCNLMRGTLSQSQFFIHMRKIIKRFEEKNGNRKKKK